MTDQIVVPAGEHLQKRTLTIVRFIIYHPNRHGTPIFDATHRLLIGKNPGARCETNNRHCSLDLPLELHHDHVEWCDSLGVNWEKVRAEVPDFPWDTPGIDFRKNEAGVWVLDDPAVFIDSAWNAKRVLCKRHHTGEDHGIHMLDYPTWEAQKFLRDDVVFSPDEAVANAALGALSQGS